MTSVAIILGTTSIVAFNALLVAVFVGIGLGLRRAFGLRAIALDDLLLAFWTGFSATLAVLLVWNFVWPVGGAAFTLVTTGGLVCLAAMRADVAHALRVAFVPRSVRLALVAYVVWVAHVSTGAMTYWDTALYHMQGVQWAREFAVVPGLANLLGPLGFNNASWLYNAMLDVGPWRHHAWHVSNGVLVSMLGVQLALTAIRFDDHAPWRRSIAMLAAVLLPIATNYVLEGRASSFSTVVPSSLLVLVLVLRGYESLADADAPDEERAYSLAAASLLGVAAVVIKVSSGVFVAVVLLVGLWDVARRRPVARRWRRRALAWSVVAVGVTFGAWAARGVVLTGYPLFPIRALSVATDWRVPAEHARAEYDFVFHSARATAENFRFVSRDDRSLLIWIRHYVRSAVDDPYEVVAPSVLAGLAALVLMVRRREVVLRRSLLAPGWMVLAPVTIALLAWWVTAPMPHYGAPFFWAFAGLLVTQAVVVSDLDSRRLRRAARILVVIGVSPCVIAPAWAGWLGRYSGPVAAVVDFNVKVPEPGRWFQFGLPTQPHEIFRTQSGLLLRVPTGEWPRCWDLPLPCTHNPAPNLRLRVQGQLQKGFTVDDRWEMINWPEPFRWELLPALRRAWATEDHTTGGR